MEVKTFLIQFEKSLMQGGLDNDEARRHTLKIANSLTARDRAEIARINDFEEVNRVASGYLKKVGLGPVESEKPQDKIPVRDAEKNSAERTEIYEKDEDGVKVKVASGRSFSTEAEYDSHKTSKFTPASDEHGATRTIDRAATKTYAKVALTPEGKKNYRKELIKKLPMFFALYLSIGLLSFTVYTLIAALIAVILLALVATTIVGSVGTLAGLIYGIIKLFTVVPEGLYEIGFAIVIAGVSMILCICIYNLAVRVAPILWKSFTVYLKKNVIWRIKQYLNRMRKEANNA